MSKIKLVIEIDEDRLTAIRKYPLIYNSDEYKAIANGTEITDDMISREALKNEYAEKCAGECDCCLYNDHYDGCKLINNAPTIGKENDNGKP